MFSLKFTDEPSFHDFGHKHTNKKVLLIRFSVMRISFSKGDASRDSLNDTEEERPRRSSLSWFSSSSRQSNPASANSSSDVTEKEGKSVNVFTALGSGLGRGMSSFGSAVASGVSEIGASVRSSSVASLVEEENKARNIKLSYIETLMSDLRLQVPSSSAGLAVAYSSATMSPLDGEQSGMILTWHRTSTTENGELTQVQHSKCPFYAPSCDDIGARLCVQCQDDMSEGYARYLESERVVEADPLLRSITESAISSAQYSAKKCQCSLGMEVREGPELEQNLDADSRSTPSSPERFIEQLLRRQKRSALNEAEYFLELPHSKVIHVDRAGILLDISSDTENGSGSKSLPAEAPNLGNDILYCLSVACSNKLSVACAGPRSLVLTIPVSGQSAVPSGAVEGVDSTYVKKEDEAAEDGKSEVYEPQSPPWSFVTAKWNDSISSMERNVSTDESATVNEAQSADMETRLAKYFNTLPRETKSIKLCIVCDSRMDRDVLVLSIRTLACRDPSEDLASEEEISTMLPWKGSKTTSETHLETSVEMGSRLNFLEHENVALKQLLSGQSSLQKSESSISISSREENEIKLKAAAHQEKTAMIQAELDKLIGEKLEAEGELEVRDRRIAQLRRENEQLAADLSNAKKESLTAQETSKGATGEATEAKAALEILQIENKSLQEALTTLEQKVEDATAVEAELRSKTEDMERRLENALEVAETKAGEADHAVAHVKELEQQLFSAISGKIKQDAQIAVLTDKLAKRDGIASERDAYEEEAKKAKVMTEKATAQMNHERKKAEGASKELKKVMKENALTLQEFERALQRKSEECNLLYEKLQDMKSAAEEQERQLAALPNPAAVAISMGEGMKRFGSITANSVNSVFGKKGADSDSTKSKE